MSNSPRASSPPSKITRRRTNQGQMNSITPASEAVPQPALIQSGSDSNQQLLPPAKSPNSAMPSNNSSPTASQDAGGTDPLLPFRYYCTISWRDKLVMVLMVPLLPFRIVGVCLSFLFGWMTARCIMMGVGQEAWSRAPFVGWRRCGQRVIRAMSRCVFFFSSFHCVSVRGHPEDLHNARVVAPLIVAAPHTSYVDAFICSLFECGVVARAAVKQIPVVGVCVQALQPIFVDRENTESRHGTLDSLKQRCQTEIGRWPPVFLFPEGTTSNGKCLFKFKAGAFSQSHAVQLVSISYHTCMNSFSPLIMTWDTNMPLWKIVVCIFLQPSIRVTVRLLGIYHPSLQERQNPPLYAASVQEFFSAHLRIPSTNFGYKDARRFSGGVGHYRA